MQYYAEICPYEKMTGRTLTSTWWGDFRVAAELGGLAGIKDTYKRGLSLAKDDKIYGTEFAIVLNWLSWLYHDLGVKAKAQLFSELYYDFNAYVLANWPKEWREYYRKETD